ncbi:MAG: PIG-L family deacetylase [Chloroflexi bacterium]|nr:PIG-L family deacetylase [Chloroflexota bacterium]
MKNAHVLAVYGHPDDEGQVTGTLANLIERGVGVTLVCATRGEVGEISDTALSTPETLWYTRELELRASMAQIGLRDVRFLPFRDSGMAGTPENDDPRSLHQAPEAAVVGELVGIIRDVRPSAVFTWDPTGGYGHPDHIATHRHTVAAFDAAGDPEAYPAAGEPWASERLYWGSFGMKRFAGIFLELERRGQLPEAIDPERRERFVKAMAEPDAPVHVLQDVRAYAPLKRAAAAMHRSQFGENSIFARIPADLRDQFFGEERFFQARPEWPAGKPAQQGFDWLE